jgi:shikimate kinase
MRIFLAGVSDVGKTTIGARLATLLGYRFFDLDHEIESFFEMPLERLQNLHLTLSSFRAEAARALKHVLAREDSRNSVIALPPSGLMDGYWRVVKKTADAVIVVLRDEPENLLERITFYDIDSRPIRKTLTKRDKRFYLRRIKEDISYFRRSYQRAHFAVDIAGQGPEEASVAIRDMLTGIVSRIEQLSG